MKRFAFGLLGLALLGGPMLGQAPVGPRGVPAGAPVAVAPDGACCAAGSCPVNTRTVCVPEHYAKKTTKVVYNCGSEPFCLCYFRGLFKSCGCEPNGHCEGPHTRRYLVKKVRTCETDAIKCVPAQVPDGCYGPPR